MAGPAVATVESPLCLCHKQSSVPSRHPRPRLDALPPQVRLSLDCRAQPLSEEVSARALQVSF